MKTRIILFVGFLLLNFFLPGVSGAKTSTSVEPQNSITVYASPDLFGLTSIWAAQYEQVNKDLKISVVKSGSFPETSENVIGFFEDTGKLKSNNQETWSLVVGHDVIVPVMNNKNPLFSQINHNGISVSSFVKLSGIQEKTDWKKLLAVSEDSPSVPLHIYMMDDQEVISGVNNFLKISTGIVGATKVSNQTEMISAIQKDPGALGFCKLTQIVRNDNRELAENIKLVPIDKNSNGRIDFMEDIYSNLQTFSRGVWIGKYPKALSGNIYALSAFKPKNDATVKFLKWVLSEGQLVISENGYNELAYNERLSQLNKIDQPETITTNSSETSNAWIKLVLWGILAFALASFVLDRIFRKKSGVVNQVPKSQFLQAFDENSVVIPKGVFFDKTHTWAFQKKNGMITIGIDDFLQHVTGPISRIEMKKPGEKIKKGEVLLTVVQVGKQLSIYSPISGTIAACNKSLRDEPKLINSAPYANGWIYLVEPLNWFLEVQFLFNAEKYKTWLTDEFLRLKDFLARTIKVTSADYELVVMQDGGALKDNVLFGLKPETWEDFQTEFIDQSK